jgi:hypothetical protein
MMDAAKVPVEQADEMWERGAFRQMNWKPQRL